MQQSERETHKQLKSQSFLEGKITAAELNIGNGDWHAELDQCDGHCWLAQEFAQVTEVG